jgi:hypothetical protein
VIGYEQLKFRRWKDEDYCAIYNLQSGDLHLVDAIGFHILKLIGQGCASYPSLTQSIFSSHLLGDDDEDAYANCILSSLTQLENAGLLSKVEI